MSFSNFAEASVRMPRASAVLRMDAPRKLADSNTTSAVSSTIAVLAAHAATTGFVFIRDDKHVGLDELDLPSSVVSVLPRGGR